MSEQNEEKLLALIYVVEKVGELMYAAKQVNEKRPNWNGRVSTMVTKGLETGVKAYHQGGITSKQLQGLEGLIVEIDEILTNKR